MAELVTATVDRTHLFPGAEVSVRLPHGALSAAELVLTFSDGVAVPAELIRRGPSEAILAVAAYVTAAGAKIPAKSWNIREWSVRGDAVLLRVGELLPVTA